MRRKASKAIALMLSFCMIIGVFPSSARRVLAADKQVTLTYASVAGQDGEGLQRYAITFQVSGAEGLGNTYWTNSHTVYVDGEEKGGLNYLGDGSTLTLYLPYAALEDGKEKAEDMGIHSVLIPKGTVIGDLELTETVAVKIDGTSAGALTPVKLTYNEENSGAQPAPLYRWLVSYEVTGAKVPASGVGVLSALTDGEKSSYGTIQRTESVFSAMVCFEEAETITKDSNYLAEGGAHTFDVKRGTILNDSWCVENTVDTMILNRLNPYITPATEQVTMTFREGTPQDGAGLERYWLWFDIDKMPQPFTGNVIYVDGVQVDYVSYYYAGGTSAREVAILLPYSYLEEGKETASSIGRHVVTIQAGTAVTNNTLIANDIAIMINGSEVKEVTQVTFKLNAGASAAQDENGRYLMTVNVDGIDLGSYNYYDNIGGRQAGYLNGRSLKSGDDFQYTPADSTSMYLTLNYAAVNGEATTADALGTNYFSIPAGTLIVPAQNGQDAPTLYLKESYVVKLDGATMTQVSKDPTELKEKKVTATYDWRNCGRDTTLYFATTADDPLVFSANWDKTHTFNEGGVFVNGVLQESAYLVKISNRLYAVSGINPAAGDIVTLSGSVISGYDKVIFQEISFLRNADLSYSQYDKNAPEIPAETVSLKDVYIDAEDANYEIAHTPLLENGKVAVTVNGKTTNDYFLREVGEYKVKTVYETTTFSEIISKVGDVTYEQDVMIYRTGDSNNDGKSTLSDLMRLKKQQTGIGEGISKADAKGVDLDDDDKVTGTDAALMRDLLGEQTTVEELKKAVEGVNVGVISDLHYSVNASDGQRRLNTRKALNYYKSQNADMIILNGDVADLGMTEEYQKLVEDITAVFPNEATRPKLIFTADNHEYYEAWSHNKVPTATFEDLQTRFLTQLASVNDNSDGMNSHYVINGYHFISISADGMDANTRASYSDETKAFLEQAMAEAKAEDAIKPIFVNVHQPPENTVIGSDVSGGGSPYLKSILEQYENAIVFTSHTHASLANLRSIWKGAYTVLNTASLFYEDGKANTMDPIEEADQFGQGLMVHVKKNVVEIEKCDFYHNTTIGNNWVIGE